MEFSRSLSSDQAGSRCRGRRGRGGSLGYPVQPKHRPSLPNTTGPSAIKTSCSPSRVRLPGEPDGQIAVAHLGGRTDGHHPPTSACMERETETLRRSSWITLDSETPHGARWPSFAQVDASCGICFPVSDKRLGVCEASRRPCSSHEAPCGGVFLI